MKRLIKKVSYNARGELEKLIGYLVTKRSGLRLNKDQFNEISMHFVDSGGHMDGIKTNGSEKQEHYLKLHKAIDKVLKKQ
jgi:hypothetical protein